MSDVSASYAAYAADRSDSCFSGWLRERSEPEWTRAVEHPFTRELGAGTLPEAAFAEYLVQDYAFLDALVGAFGFAVGQAPDMAAKRRLVEFLGTATAEENDYFERSFDALSVPESRRTDPELAEPTKAFIDLLGRAAREGGYEETLAVLVPAEWIYERWATATADQSAESEQAVVGADLPFYYAEWIDLHAIPPFVEFVGWLRGQLDERGPELSERRQARIERLFRRTVDLEVDFFETAYETTDTTSDAEERNRGV